MPAIQNVSTTAPGDYQTQLAQIERERRMAEAMQAQAMQPIEAQQTGRMAVPISPLQGAGKIAQSLAANYRQSQIDEKEKGLRGDMTRDRSDTIARALAAAQGTPGQSAETMETGGAFNPEQNRPAVAATAADPQRAYSVLAGSQDPALQQAGLAGALAGMKPKEFKTGKPGDYILDSQGNTVRQLAPAPQPGFNMSPGQTRFGPDGQPVVSLPPTPEKAPEKWSEPYKLGGQTVQRNEVTGQIRQAVTLPPQTNVNVDARERQRTFENEAGARKEFNDLPEVKNYKTVIPIVNSARNAPDTPAGDLDLIYAVGKVLDPNSVVREGEMALVIKSGSPLQRFQGTVNYITSGRGRLPPEQRAQLMNMLNGRVQGLEEGYNAARSTYEPMVQRSGLNPLNVFTELPASGAKAPKSDRRDTPRNSAARVVVDY